MKAVFLTLAASALLVVPMAFSQAHPSTEGRNHTNAQARHEEAMVDRHVDRLALMFNLTPEQKKEAATYFSDAWNANKPVMKQLREDRKNLDKDILAKADQSKLSADAAAIGRDRGSMMANSAYAQEKFLSLLSPAEQAKYEKLQATRFGASNFAPGHRAPGAVSR
jgi:Spy/CpxP family protein refolding chaperone